MQRGQQQTSDNQIDELMERLKELARRQEQEAERQRRRSRGGQTAQAGGGASQRALAEEAEEAARRLERLARELRSPDMMQAARRLQEAADAMREAAANADNQGFAEAGEALDRLREVQRQLQGEQSGRLARDIEDARRRAADLANDEADIADQVAGLGNLTDEDRIDRIRRLIERKEEMESQVADLERGLDSTSAEFRRDEGDASLPADAPTSEWGNYSIDGKQFSVTDIVSETDGDGGLSDGDDVCTTTKWGDFNCESDAEEAFSFMRVGRFTVKLRVEDDNGSAIYRKTATVERSAERLFVENQSKAFTYAFPDEADKISVRLYENGSGRVDFGPDESSTIEHSWKVNAAGSLDYYETMDDDSTGYWLFAPIKDSRGRDMALISFSHKDGTTSHESAFFISELVGEVVAK